MATVLLIDDDADLIDINRVVLTARDFTVRAALSASEARKALQEHQPDLVVLDIMMETPTIGIDLAREIHQGNPKLPILMLSGIRKAMDLPFKFDADETWLPVAQFLEKPFSPATLADKVQTILNGA